ncbi:ABC transporter permease [Flavobacteriaceae bacterium MHTCC 0001]
MIKNSIKFAFRIFKKDKLFTLINILGLALGFAICILVLGYVEFEFSYEKHIENADNVYRLTAQEYRYKKKTRSSSRAPSRLAKVVPKAVLGINYAVEVITEPCLMRTDKIKLARQKVYWVGKDFFNVFKGILLQGNPETVLDAPLKMAITQSKAKALFGKEDPIGKVIKVNEGMPFKVTGIVKDPPANSHLKYEYILSLSTWVKYGWLYKDGYWGNLNYYTYVAIDDNVSKDLIKRTLNEFVLSHLNPKNSNGRKLEFSLQPIKDIHLNSNFSDEISVNGSKDQVYIVLGIGIAILLIVFVNFVNLSIAIGLKRFKDTGIRKVLGANQLHLRTQFFIEAFLLNSISLILSILIVAVSYRYLAYFFDIHFSFNSLLKPSFWIYGCLIFGFCIVVVGFYPAMVLSSTKVLTAIKGKIVGKQLSRNIVKNGLLVFQFSIAVFLIFGTFIVYKQVDFMKNADLGIETNQVLTLTSPTSYNTSWFDFNAIKIKHDQFNIFKNELLSNPNIKGVASSMHIPGEICGSSVTDVKVVGKEEVVGAKIDIQDVDEGFLPIYKAEFLSGNNFKENITQLKREVVLNEKARKAFGFKTNEDAVEQSIKMLNTIWKIKGVVKDFHIQSLSASIEPTVFPNRHPAYFGYYLVKIDSKNTKKTLDFIASTWKKMYPEDPFIPNFSDDFFKSQYVKNERFGKLFNALTLLAILVVNMGLIAMISFIVSDKLKELSIRRVLGANPKVIYFILSKGILKVTGIAIVIGLPLSYYFLNNWLQNFAYSIHLSVSDFVLSPLIIVSIALLNITYFVIKVLKKNPATIIREE